ncbi:MAG: MFS transporter [Acidimicrobiia bacterium]
MFAANTSLGIVTTAAGKQVYDLTHSELALGLLGLAEFAPAFVLVFVSGVVADRYQRRRVAAAGYVGGAVVLAALATYVALGSGGTVQIFVAMILAGTARAFTEPAVRSLPADTVAPEALPRLSPRVSFIWQSGMILGPVAGGFLYVAGVWLTYATAAALLGVAAIAVLFVRARTGQGRAATRRAATRRAATGAAPDESGVRRGIREAREGARFVRSQPVLLGAISLDLFAVLFGGAVALLPAIAEDRLGVGAVGLGWLRAAIGIGAASMTLILMVRPVTRRVGRVLLLAVAVFGLGTVVLGVTTSFAVAFVALAVASAADAISVFIRTTLVPLITPSAMRGRVLALESVFIGASNQLGAFESGVAGQILGPAAAVGLGGVATLVVAAFWWVRFPKLRDLDRFPDAEADERGGGRGDAGDASAEAP